MIHAAGNFGDDWKPKPTRKIISDGTQAVITVPAYFSDAQRQATPRNVNRRP